MARVTLLSGLVLAGTMMASAQEKKGVSRELLPFQGTWKVVRAELDGKELPEKIPPELRFRFSGDKLTVTESRDEAETGSVKVDSRKQPAEIDLVGPKGEKVAGIYRFDKDGKMSLCFVKGKAGARPRSFDTAGTAALLMVLEKLKE